LAHFGKVGQLSIKNKSSHKFFNLIKLIFWGWS